MFGLRTPELIVVVCVIAFAATCDLMRGSQNGRSLKRIAIYAFVIVVASAILWDLVEYRVAR